MPEDTSLRISADTHKDLVKIQGSIQSKTGRDKLRPGFTGINQGLQKTS